MSQYPHDEFDDVPPYQSGEAGKHRAPAAAAIGGGGRGGLKWIALLTVVALAVGIFSWLVLPTLRDSEPEAGDQEENAEEQAEDGDGEDEEEGDGEDEDTGDDDGDTEEGDATEDVAADSSAPVQVFSYQGEAGQEQTLQEELETMGYNVTHVDEWGWGDIETPVIYYPASAEEHAQDVAENLGIETLIEDGGNWSYVAVVVGPEYAE